MSDWSTIANVGTAVGTLVLGAATFASVRSAQRSARVAERSLLIGLRPVLIPARPGDPDQSSRWADRHLVVLPPGRACAQHIGDVIYLAIALRNAGPGLAVLSGWKVLIGLDRAPPDPPRDSAAFRRLQRDLFVPSGDVGYWQSALRDPSDPKFQELARSIERDQQFHVELLYGDYEGGQPTVSLFAVYRQEDDAGDDLWRADVARHWGLDGRDPRI